MKEKSLVPATSVPVYEIKDIDLREYFLVVFKRRRLVLWFLIVSITVAAIYTFLQTPVYRSTLRIHIDPLNSSVIPAVVPKEGPNVLMFLTTQFQLLKGRAIANRVQEKLNLSPEDLVPEKEKQEVAELWSKRKPEDRKNYVADELMKSLEIVSIRETTLFTISFLTPDPQLSKTLAETWANEYIEYSLASQLEYSRKAGILLAEQIKNLHNEIKKKQQMLQDYSVEKKVILVGETGRSVTASKLEDLNRELSAATAARIAKETTYLNIQKHGKYAQPEVRMNPVIIGLKQEYARLQNEYSQKSSLYMPDFPVMQTLRNQMEQINQAIEKEASDVFVKIVENARSDYQQSLAKENSLKSQVEEVKGDAIYAGQDEFNYSQMRLELAEKQQNLETLLAKQTEAASSAQAQEMKAITIRVVDEPLLAKRPESPNVFNNMSISIALGLIIGICVAFISDYLDRSFKTLDDVQRHLQVPFLGMVPQHAVNGQNNGNGTAIVKQENMDGSPSEALDLLTLYNPDSIESEAFRTVRASLLVSFPESPPRTILITSGKAGEGKTFVASNLAVTLAQLNKRIVLVDADMRNPRLHRVWKLSNEIGLTNYLTSDTSAQSVLRSTQLNGLYVITSGARTPRPTELLSSQRVGQLLLELEKDFDHIIFDTPPIIPVSDALVLAPKCNSVLLVVRAGVTSRDVVQMANLRLTQFDATVTGAVLNGTEPYFDHHYYNTYGQEQTDPQSKKILKYLKLS
jgi:capsular exopolysaccharide synthesis family protein